MTDKTYEIVNNNNSPDEENSAPTDKTYEIVNPPSVGAGEAFGRGAGQMAALGFAPEAIAAAKSIATKTPFKNELAQQKITQDEAWNSHPWAYGSGMAAGILPAIIGAIGSGGTTAEAGLAGLGIRGMRALGSVPTVANLASKALSGVAGEASGILPSIARGTATALSSPIVQGGIYGSSENKGPITDEGSSSNRLFNAATGALGAKVLEPVIPAIVKGGEKLWGKGLEKTKGLLTGTYTPAQIASGAAHDLGISLPAGAASPGPVSGATAELDPLKKLGSAAAKTLQETGDKISDFAGNVLPEDAGSNIKNSFMNWLKTGSRKQIDALYNPIKDLTNSVTEHPLTSLENTIADITAKHGRIQDVLPTLDIVSRARETGSLTFQEMRELRELISNEIDFNKIPGMSKNLDDSILGKLRDAVTKDMYNVADVFHSGPGTGNYSQTIRDIDNQASKIYGLRDYLANKLGSGAPGDKTDATIFNNLSKAATVKNGDTNFLQTVKNVVSPEAWESFSQALSKNLSNPERGFSFGNFQKTWNNISPDAKDIIFGDTANNSNARNVFEKINTLGTHAGEALDHFAGKAKLGSSPWAIPEMMAPIVEMSLTGGFPLKTTAGLIGSSALGFIHARDVARALPEMTERAKIFDSINSSPEIKAAWDQVIKNTKNSNWSSQKGIEAAFGNLSRIVGSKTGMSVVPTALKALAINAAGMLNPAPKKNEEGHANGGRIGRATGGRIMNHKSEAENLIRLADKTKKALNNSTESLLAVPDEAVTKALSIANEAI